MKIGMKLGLAFGAPAVIILILIFMGLNTASDLNKSIQDLTYDKFKKTVWANDIIDQINMAAHALRNAIITEKPDVREKELKRLDEARKIVTERIDSLKATEKSEKGMRLLSELETIRKDYFEVRERLIKIIETNNKAEIENMLF